VRNPRLLPIEDLPPGSFAFDVPCCPGLQLHLLALSYGSMALWLYRGRLIAEAEIVDA
jgi:hypothetical protein